jgi:hypothetical protein
MKQSVPPLIKVRDIALGFFGWLIFSNIVLLLIFYFEEEAFWDFNDVLISLSIVMWLSAIIAFRFLFVKKRIWVCFGIATNIIINIGYWIAMLLTRSDITLGQFIMLTSLPLPTGLLVMFLRGN